MGRSCRRYLVTADVAVGLPRFADASEEMRVCGITVEEAQLVDVIGVPVTLNFDDGMRVGTVVASRVHATEGRWTVDVALVVPGTFQVEAAIEGPAAQFTRLAPAIKVVSGGGPTLVKRIDSFAFVQSSCLPKSRITTIMPQQVNFAMTVV